MLTVKLLISTAFDRFEHYTREHGRCPNLTEFLSELQAQTDLPPEQWLEAVVEGIVSIQDELESQAGRRLDRQRLVVDNPLYATAIESAFSALRDTRSVSHREAAFAEEIERQWLIGGGLKPGAIIGPYTLEQHLGEGGMGTVWKARQEHPVRRHVAIKLIKSGIDSRRVVARFELERQALAIMDHPHIAKVLEAGATVEGQPYFVMELVDGIPFNRYCDNEKLTIRQRLELFIPICQAVHHAHQKGILHRDLKPSNILVFKRDGLATPKVIDFGLAKALRDSGSALQATCFTELGQVVGTFQYMSPEQAKTNSVDVDIRSDIYSLGVVLFELLTGTTPIERKDWREKSVLSALEAVRDHEPPRPSARLHDPKLENLKQISQNRAIDSSKLQTMLKGELDWIVMKAIEKDRVLRYESASALALDVQNYLCGEYVVARPPSFSYQLGKLWRKRKLLISAGCSVFLILLFSLLVTSRLLIIAQAARKTADDALADSVKKRSNCRTRKEEQSKLICVR